MAAWTVVLPGRLPVVIRDLPPGQRTAEGAIAAAVAQLKKAHPDVEMADRPEGATAMPGANQRAAGMLGGERCAVR